jgi:hypothetical protein
MSQVACVSRGPQAVPTRAILALTAWASTKRLPTLQPLSPCSAEVATLAARRYVRERNEPLPEFGKRSADATQTNRAERAWRIVAGRPSSRRRRRPEGRPTGARGRLVGSSRMGRQNALAPQAACVNAPSPGHRPVTVNAQAGSASAPCRGAVVASMAQRSDRRYRASRPAAGRRGSDLQGPLAQSPAQARSEINGEALCTCTCNHAA